MVLANQFKRRKQAIYQKIKQCAYILFLVQLHCSINNAIIIHVFYHPWHQHFIIWIMNMRHNILSGVRKNVFWTFRIKAICTSVVIFLWDITKKKKRKNTQLSYWRIAYIHDIWYILESVYLSKCVLVTRHVPPDWSLYCSLR